ncbi:bifunctional aminoacyl-tRNA synthetase [Metarhizobium album]|uniref:Bifunctional aminoacyl-tRNA synthetase n=1 Tax=Metarhizobium album TaxID=2182425 RepID=A0A2U2DFZ3_9HYPH|nr:bifunctional aminoacyl-tRNA synthetase [Rhizobium album]
MVRFTGEASNQVFTELAQWEQILKDTSLARPAPPSP